MSSSVLCELACSKMRKLFAHFCLICTIGEVCKKIGHLKYERIIVYCVKMEKMVQRVR